jgi:hypothetical protein
VTWAKIRLKLKLQIVRRTEMHKFIVLPLDQGAARLPGSAAGGPPGAGVPSGLNNTADQPGSLQA